MAARKKQKGSVRRELAGGSSSTPHIMHRLPVPLSWLRVQRRSEDGAKGLVEAADSRRAGVSGQAFKNLRGVLHEASDRLADRFRDVLQRAAVKPCTGLRSGGSRLSCTSHRASLSFDTATANAAAATACPSSASGSFWEPRALRQRAPHATAGTPASAAHTAAWRIAEETGEEATQCRGAVSQRICNRGAQSSRCVLRPCHLLVGPAAELNEALTNVDVQRLVVQQGLAALHGGAKAAGKDGTELGGRSLERCGQESMHNHLEKFVEVNPFTLAANILDNHAPDPEDNRARGVTDWMNTKLGGDVSELQRLNLDLVAKHLQFVCQRLIVVPSQQVSSCRLLCVLDDPVGIGVVVMLLVDGDPAVMHGQLLQFEGADEKRQKVQVKAALGELQKVIGAKAWRAGNAEVRYGGACLQDAHAHALHAGAHTEGAGADCIDDTLGGGVNIQRKAHRDDRRAYSAGNATAAGACWGASGAPVPGGRPWVCEL
mmetsp:Transcript_2846/g.7909  ORF Transcript_2846/g.7909 Transcript_2846/m.7909 type:complete len:488 (+) Transcript_2846:103-1566(+)